MNRKNIKVDVIQEKIPTETYSLCNSKSYNVLLRTTEIELFNIHQCVLTQVDHGEQLRQSVRSCHCTLIPCVEIYIKL